MRNLLARAKPVSTFLHRRLLAGLAVVAFVLAAPAVSSARDLSKGKAGHSRSATQSGAKFSLAAAGSILSSFRHSHGLPAVRIDPTLMKLARQQAEAMVANDRLSHDVGGDFSSRLRRAGYRSRGAAENISAGYFTLADAFSSWRDSSSHRANLLLQGATRFGIAAMSAPNSQYKMYWALIVAEPAGGGRRR